MNNEILPKNTVFIYLWGGGAGGRGGRGGAIYYFKMLTPNVEVRETTSVLLIPFTVVRQSVSY